MRTTIAIDRDLLTRAQAYTGLTDESAVVYEALKALVQREAARRLASLGGSQPDVEGPRRRRQEGHEDPDA
ncbi:type II toxin-antitoxin system VapB family antitoxin [Caballeronia sp. BCC1704]|uniref:type II toxin-antitoxin system VapB family antitoxin n=1 Tax=Caballeronia sp. BCC1704 TaxID=2676300 RepID=UPI00158A68E6|nr:type II toxin-antitoxin system VapB family antitoxin [Caballeronia sp. BCC1704]